MMLAQHAAGHGTSLPSPQEMSRGEGGRRRKVTGFGGARAASHRREPGSGHARPCLVWGQPGQEMLETSFIRCWRPRLSDARRHLIRRSLRSPYPGSRRRKVRTELLFKAVAKERLERAQYVSTILLMYEVCSADRATRDSQGHWVSEDHSLPRCSSKLSSCFAPCYKRALTFEDRG